MSKSLITVEQLRAYTGNYEEDVLDLYTVVCESATDVVIDYLGFDPSFNDYDEVFSGIGDYKQYLKVRDIEGVYYLEIDGREIDLRNISYKDDYIFTTNRKKIFTEGVDNIRVKFFAGMRKLPEIVTLTALRIAALMLQEFGSNIGISSKSFADQSRTFINYSDYSKYLMPLKYLRIVTL